MNILWLYYDYMIYGGSYSCQAFWQTMRTTHVQSQLANELYRCLDVGVRNESHTFFNLIPEKIWKISDQNRRIYASYCIISFCWRVPSALIGKRPKSQLPCLCNTAAWATGRIPTGPIWSNDPQWRVVSRSKWFTKRSFFLGLCVPYSQTNVFL